MTTITTKRTTAITMGTCLRLRGSNSIPTATKNRTANASRIGNASLAARAASSDEVLSMTLKS